MNENVNEMAQLVFGINVHSVYGMFGCWQPTHTTNDVERCVASCEEFGSIRMEARERERHRLNLR